MLTEEMQRVKRDAKIEFSKIAGVQGVGLGGVTTLIVYVRDLATARKIPASFDGFLVETKIVGSIIATA